MTHGRGLLHLLHVKLVGGTQACDDLCQNGWFVDDSGALLSPVVDVPVTLLTRPSPVVVILGMLIPFWHI